MLSMKAWAVLYATLFPLALGLIVDSEPVRAGAVIALGLLAIERVVNWHRGRRPCGQNPLGDPVHACYLPRDGHTMHACRHGDCSWGH